VHATAAFVPAAYITRAYDDAPIPIPHHQVTTQPSLSAAIIAALGLTGAEEVFEVGTGYGYQTALLARLAARVISIDIWPDLAAQARRDLAAQGTGNVVVLTGDGTGGAPDSAPFGVIVVSAACPRVPPPLAARLRTGGRLVQPAGPGGRGRGRPVSEGTGRAAAGADRDGGQLRPAPRRARFSPTRAVTAECRMRRQWSRKDRQRDPVRGQPAGAMRP
jgi:protein-L-isoaspartate O-methyltransferase